MSESLSISLTGITDLPPGKIAAIVTSLEMFAPPPERPDPPGLSGFSLEPIGRTDAVRYLAIYRVLGERWMWFSRLVKPLPEIEAILADPAVEFFAVRSEGRDVGLLELDFRIAGDGELAFFGLTEPVLGKGAGRWLMNRALKLAWSKPISRFWVHTCTLDHQGAPEFYQRSGFRVFKRSVEVDEDPRLNGHMPRDSVAHHPVIERERAEGP
ncbi:GNAT family N-acetyltransferase [Bosea sp. (in: a-proteobacteria)]|jgi:GNAT superfamily N-acetyltransferase|uniref:GNAT family N-acetyltransferase n=1 Tax=Bosea sp. (in: a-proteobacteria) TaxID=1871050 RepID=UPI003F6F8A62